MAEKLLNVFLNQKLAGTYKSAKQGYFTFQYNADYLASSKEPLSLSLPLREKEFDTSQTEPFFSGLLPDEAFRKRLARYLGVSEENTFSLLQAVGRECAGAVAFYPPGEMPKTPGKTDKEELDDKKLLELLDLMKSHPLLAERDGIRLSLAGSQNKMAVGYENGKVFLIKNGSPTTHILKPVMERATADHSVQNEFFCMKLAKRCGLSAPEVHIVQVGDISCFVVDRYDRIKVDGIITRLHQEDFCQALGIPPSRKYEIEGGPSVKDGIALLKKHSALPVADIDAFLKTVEFNYLIGNADAHGKNFSILYGKNGIRLSPVYDVMDTDIYPQVSKKMAMKIGKKYDARYIFKHHWLSYTEGSERAKERIWKQMTTFKQNVLEQAERLAAELNASTFASPVYERVLKTVEERCRFMENEVPLAP